VVTAALPNINTLSNTLLARQMDVNLGNWNGPSDDLLQTMSMPVFMIQNAIASMATVKEIGDQEAAEKKRDLILEILGVVFIFIPFLDDLTPELEALDGVFQTVAAAGNVALGIQSIVSNPASAPMEILGLLGGAGVRTEDEFASMAAARRSLSEDDLESLGSDFEKSDTELQKSIRPSCRN
jgi:glucan 1,3-beta-glucosidase